VFDVDGDGLLDDDKTVLWRWTHVWDDEVPDDFLPPDDDGDGDGRADVLDFDGDGIVDADKTGLWRAAHDWDPVPAELLPGHRRGARVGSRTGACTPRRRWSRKNRSSERRPEARHVSVRRDVIGPLQRARCSRVRGRRGGDPRCGAWPAPRRSGQLPHPSPWQSRPAAEPAQAGLDEGGRPLGLDHFTRA